MKKLKLIIYPNDVLTKKCQPIENIKPKNIELGKMMLAYLRLWKGIGLSAPQVGRLQNILVFNTNGFHVEEVKTDDGEIIAKINRGTSRIMFNPEIIWESIEDATSIEGCLSFPGKHVFVKRSKEIEVEYINENLEKKKEKFSDLTARVIKHELDHLEGILFTDYGMG
jgi:peptide deformylase